MADLPMPRLSDSMEEGTILKWLKEAGNEIKRGEELVEIETDKANMTYEADADGVLEIVAEEGDTLQVGETIARIHADGMPAGAAQEAKSESSAPSEEKAKPASKSNSNGGSPSSPSDGDTKAGVEQNNGGAERSATSQNAPAATSSSASAETSSERVKASPVAKRIAGELGIDLRSISGTGPGGRILKGDVEAAKNGQAQGQDRTERSGDEQATSAVFSTPAASSTSAASTQPGQPSQAATQSRPSQLSSTDSGSIKGEVETVKLTKLQQTVARRMAESKATAPEFVLNLEVKMDNAVRLRNELKATTDQKPPSFNDFVVKAVALALREHPRANGAYRDGQFELYSRINVGIAVAGQDALVVPTIFDADRKSIGEISRESRHLAGRVRNGEITPPELAGGTFTISNLGMYGISNFTAVINPPQAAILAVGELAEKAVVENGEITTGHRMQLTLTCDHRILYGADAAEFFVRIRELLENPLHLAL